MMLSEKKNYQNRIFVKGGKKCGLALILAYSLIPPVLFANTIADIYATVTHFLEQNTAKNLAINAPTTVNDQKVEIKVGRLDSRLRLKACQTPLQAFLPQAGRLRGKVTIGVRCESTKPWTLYVPAEVLIFEQVIVSMRPLRRGHIISPTDITRTRVKTSDSNASYFTKAEDVIGKVLIRHLNAGKTFSAQILKSQRLVYRGQAVTLIAITNDLQVRARGKALSDGALGDVVKVQNLKSKRVIEGIVKKQGTVQVIM